MKPFYIKFNVKYFTLSLILLLIETLIALYVHDKIIRPHIGDVLVVILIYTFILTFLDIKNKMLLNIGVFLFACVIEFAQYFHFAEWFGLKDNKIAMIVLGNSFSWIDILCYAMGSFCIFTFHKILK